MIYPIEWIMSVVRLVLGPGRSDLSLGWSSPWVSLKLSTSRGPDAHGSRCAGLGQRWLTLRPPLGVGSSRSHGVTPRASPRGRHDAPPGRESGRGVRDGAGETDGETGRGLVACGCASRGRRVRVLLRDSTEHEDTRDSTPVTLTGPLSCLETRERSKCYPVTVRCPETIVIDIVRS